MSQYVGYNAMDDFFPKMAMKPNPQCSSSHCRLRQEEYQKYLETHPLPVDTEEVKAEEEVVHEANEWGECICELGKRGKAIGRAVHFDHTRRTALTYKLI